ncbi:MAG: MYXO-CTERM sorting domain-containing protein [Polyangiales bacterium]
MCLALSLAAAASAVPAPADAVVVARVTRRGYILTDDPDFADFGDQIPAGNTRETYRFIQEVTSALSYHQGFLPGRFLASMQLPSTQDPLAYYLPIRNEVRGLGMRGADGRSEVFDNNAALGTSFSIDGYLYLNSLRFYTDPRAVNYGRYLICTQEFGHRFGAFVETPAYPESVTNALGDAGATTGDAEVGDAEVGDAEVDASAPDVVLPAALARDALLGRGNRTTTGVVVNRSHWNYFFNSGGSPMEGNNWEELSPGMFRTGRPTFRFSDFDLYLMGLIPRDQVRPGFLIVDPQNVPRGVGRDSPPEFYNRTVSVRGRRVDITIDDVVRQNGVRNPPYPSAPRELDVVWILWAPVGAVDNALADEFDEAIDSCALGYSTSTGNRGRLNAVVAPATIVDAGEKTDASRPDITLPEDVTRPGPDDDGGVASDAGLAADATVTADAGAPPPPAEGCGCAVPGARRTRSVFALVALAAFAARRRRRRD